MKTIKFKVVVFWMALFWVTPALADVEGFRGTIKQTLTDTQYFGKCMVELDYQSSIDCQDYWVSFDCVGSYHSKEDTRRMWDSVQLAMALQVPIYVAINDGKKHNGYCVADRVYVK